jgi:hypothetical protein
MTAPRIRLTVEALNGTFTTDDGEIVEINPPRRAVLVHELMDDGLNVPHYIGVIWLPPEAIPQLGALGVLVGLGVFSSLEIVGEGAPPVLALEPRTIRLLKIAAKVLA